MDEAGRRKHQRFDCELPIEIIHEGHTFTALIRNISAGGAFIETDADIPFGVQIECVIQFNTDTHKYPAVVRWKEDIGIGIQFGAIRALQMWALNDFIRKL